MLDNASADLQKRGLQYLCELLQSGALLLDRRAIVAKLWALRWSSDTKVRSWLYNTLARLKAREFRDYLSHQILLGEKDEENLTWAIAAFFSMSHPNEIDALLEQKPLFFRDTAAELSSQLYYDGSRGCQIDALKLSQRIEREALLSKWYLLLFGYDRVAARLEEMRHPYVDYVAALNSHDNDEIAEYSIWSLHMSNATDISAAKLSPEDVGRRSARIRRWYYRLTTKTPGGLTSNLDFVRGAIKDEQDETAREGLALGLARQYRPELGPALLEWFAVEQSELVRLALAPHFPRFSSQNSSYLEFVALRLAQPPGDLTNEILRARASSDPAFPRHLLNSRIEPESDSRVTIQVIGGAMSGDSKNVTNIAVGGNISIGSLNLGEMENSVVTSLTSLDQAGPEGRKLQELLQPYFALLQTQKSQLTEADRAVLLESVNDLAHAPDQPQSTRKTFVSKALACLKGTVGGMSQAAVLATATQELVHSVSQLFGL